MWCDSLSIPLLESSLQSHGLSTSIMQEKNQLSFIYQPGLGLYDQKKLELDQDGTFNESIQSKPFLRRINQEDSPILDEKCDLLSDKSDHHRPMPSPTNQENHLKRKFNPTEIVETKSRPIPESTPSQGLLLCPKMEPIKTKKKKKKIANSTDTEFLDHDDVIVDRILFDEMQSVQQQWQQFVILTMEKELQIQPSESKKKTKLKKFHRSKEFFLAYENLFDFDGMRHWCPTLKSKTTNS